MTDLLTLKEELSHKIKSAEDLTKKCEKEERVMTEPEKRESEELLADAGKLREQITALEDHERRTAVIAAEVARLKQPEKRATAPDKPEAEQRAHIEMPSYMARYGTMKAFTGKDADFRAYKAGMWLRATLMNDKRAERWCMTNGIETRAMSEGLNTAGGNLVPEEFTSAVIDLREMYGVFRKECQVIPMGRDVLTIPRRASGLTTYWVGEGSAITESDMAWTQVQLTAKKLACAARLSTELAEDAVINLADTLADDMAYQFARQEDLAGFTGDGTSTYGGITGVAVKLIDSSHDAGKIAATTGHNLLSEIDATDLGSLIGKCPQYARANAKFYCSGLANDLVFGRIGAAAGGNTMRDLGGKFAPSYLGYPIVITQTLFASTGDVGTGVFLLFGDLSKAATLGDRRGIAVRRSDDKYFLEDQIAIKATERLDINVHDVGDNTTAGPMLALIGA